MLSNMRFVFCFLVVHQSMLRGADDFSVVPGLTFSKPESNLTLDLYLPKDSGKDRACVIVIQGGGFRPQNGQRFKSFAQHLAQNGFVGALISYRGRPKHHYRDTIEDVADSVRYIRSVAGNYQIDPKRIGATGRSAGGTLAALLAVNPPDGQPRIQAAVCFAGVFDFVARFTDKDQLALQPGYENKIQSNGEWIGSAFSATDKHWLAASAINRVDKGDPPILFLHSRNDSTVPWLQSQDMHDAMQKAGAVSELKIYVDGGHAVEPRGVSSLSAMTEFFHKHL